jgi:hypothetical protein
VTFCVDMLFLISGIESQVVGLGYVLLSSSLSVLGQTMDTVSLPNKTPGHDRDNFDRW